MSSLYSLLFNLDADVTLLRRPLAPLDISMSEILLSKTLVRLLDKYRGPSRGLVLCAMCKIHLLAMCYVSFCSHCYVKLK